MRAGQDQSNEDGCPVGQLEPHCEVIQSSCPGPDGSVSIRKVAAKEGEAAPRAALVRLPPRCY